jgi:hypothetical protein
MAPDAPASASGFFFASELGKPEYSVIFSMGLFGAVRQAK